MDEKYLPAIGEGDTVATQICTALCKLVYKWFNDGDVYDNTHYLKGWWNDLSSYANWLFKYVPESRYYLYAIAYVKTDDEYAQLLADLCDAINTEEFLALHANEPKVGTVYKCDGPFRFVEDDEDEDDEDDYWEEDEDEEEDY